MKSKESAPQSPRAPESGQGERATRAIRRYLDLLRDALLGEHYIENELRIEYLLQCIREGREFNPELLANPARRMSTGLRRLRRERRTGKLPDDQVDATGLDGLSYAGLGRVRFDHLAACLELIRAEGVRGDLVEVGAGNGGAAIFMRGFLAAYELSDARVWVADRFDGRGTEHGDDAFPPDLNAVREAFARFDLLDERVVLLQGPPARTLAEAQIEGIALLRIGSHDPDEVGTALEALYDRVAPGGFVVIDTYGLAGCGAAVESFRAARGMAEPLERIDWSATAWRKTSDGEGTAEMTSRSVPRALAPTSVKDLSVVVVVHNMRREARRTLHSLSRSYQEDLSDLDYEVIVVENGSDPGQRLGEELVQSFGAEFRYVDLGEEATPSPAGAVNRGIAASTAPVLALMIDGAHVLTPGVLRYGMLGQSTYEPAVVITKQWYLGPGQQPETVARGYDADLEDRLFAEIRWPADGYRLFEVGHFIGDRDWFDGEWESNCIFVPRALIDQVGGMDESFTTAGGGFVNLDFFERMVGAPGVTLVTILGEGSFHQVHGGTTTNVATPYQVVRSFDREYEELRGRRFQVPSQRAHYVGSLPPAARRTKARHLSSYQQFANAHIDATGSAASRPAPVPQELSMQFIDAFWRSGEWHRTTWLGRRVHRPPTDLLAYQEAIFRSMPDWIVETRTGAGGRALFLASICDLVGHGQVLSIDDYALAEPPAHPRITYLRGDAVSERTAGEARELVGEQPKALVILGGGAGRRVLDAFHRYAPLVPVGSYVIVEDTILEGNPVWPNFGAGPAAAVQKIIDEGEFVPDPSLERFAITFNVRGFLKRVR